MKPFRFGVNVWRLQSRPDLAEKARRIEALGYATLSFLDHLLTPSSLYGHWYYRHIGLDANCAASSSPSSSTYRRMTAGRAKCRLVPFVRVYCAFSDSVPVIFSSKIAVANKKGRPTRGGASVRPLSQANQRAGSTSIYASPRTGNNFTSRRRSPTAATSFLDETPDLNLRCDRFTRTIPASLFRSPHGRGL
jgi:hypothetical protein